MVTIVNENGKIKKIVIPDNLYNEDIEILNETDFYNKLRNENDSLRKEIERLRSQLVETEDTEDTEETDDDSTLICDDCKFSKLNKLK